jgi:hypothetical protein
MAAMTADVEDLAVLEGLDVQVDLDTRAFTIAGVRVPFEAIVQVEVRVTDKNGTIGPGGREPPGTAWRELTVDVLLVTDDRMNDPRLYGLGVRSYATDGIAPDIEGARLQDRARRIAKAAARACNRKVIG